MHGTNKTKNSLTCSSNLPTIRQPQNYHVLIISPCLETCFSISNPFTVCVVSKILTSCSAITNDMIC